MVNIITEEGITYDDVLLVPKKTSVFSRKDVDTKTKLTKKLYINTPIISANMDTVTESAMAIAMAREGGIGIIHRFLTIEDQVKEIQKVKRAESTMIEKPYTMTQEKTLKDARDFIDKNKVSGLVIVDHYGKLVGLLTSRDLMFEHDNSKKIAEVMTKDVITGHVGIDLEDAKKLLKENKVEKLPIVDKDNFLKGLITSKDILKRIAHPKASKDKKGRLMVGAAIGVKPGFVERSKALLDAGADVLVVDIAHGHSDLSINTIRALKREFGDVEIIAGNVGTAEGAEELISAGADAIKVGIGPGSNCTTRIVTGSGMPQLTAVLNCVEVSDKHGIPVIADGGIRNSGDIAKALASGASTVMIGGMLAGTEESPGMMVMRHGRKYKFCRGMASVGANIDRREKENTASPEDENLTDYVAEGVESFVPFRGS